MTSEAKTLANRQNAQESTGPRTPHGKAVASLPVSPRHCRGFLLLTTGSSLNPGAPGLPTLPTRPQTKNLLLRNEPKSSWYPKITNPFIAKAYEAKAAFSLSRKRTQTAQKKKVFYETNPNLLGGQGSQVLFLQRFTKANVHFRYQENEPKRTQTAQKKKVFYETNPTLLGTQGSQILILQRLTKARLHFRHQENEPKRTQLQRPLRSSLIPHPSSPPGGSLKRSFPMAAPANEPGAPISRCKCGHCR
ncbi:MAG: hypothetical protein ACYTEL_01200 [Planctomycetota bacterium]|jgi:hypothetical protein